MIDRVIKWSIENRFFVAVGAAILLAWGIREFVEMPVDVFPELTAPTVTIMADAHGMAPQEVETLIAFPLETALNGVTGVRRVRSLSEVGSAVDHSPMDLRTHADWVVKPRILSVPGVSRIYSFGGDVRQYQVILDPQRMVSYCLTADQVIDALAASNENSSAGFYVEGGQEYLIRGLGRVTRTQDVGETVVVVHGEQPVMVRDLGQVIIGTATRRGAGSYRAQDAVVMGIQKQPDANTLELTGRLDEALDDIATMLPDGIEIHRRVFRQADFIEGALDNVGAAIRDGAILVVAIILLFLVSARSTAISVLAIPLSLIVTVIVLKALGATVNTMTLGGMAIAVGALVDDAIIGVENVIRRLRIRQGQPEAERRSLANEVFEAIREIRGSIVFATLIIMLVFLPLFFLSGVEGRLLAPLGQAYIISLFASLVVALTVTPALSFWLLPRARTVLAKREPRFVAWLKRAYLPLLNVSLRRWKLVAGGAAIGLAAAIVGLALSGQAFLPDFNEGSLTLSVVTLPGTSIEESDRIGRAVERVLLEQPEVASTARRTGRDELDEHGLAPHSAEVDVRLEMGDRSEEELLEVLREELAMLPGTTVVIGQPISHRIDHMLSGTRASIAVKLFGDDLYVLRGLARRVEALMQEVEGAVDIAVDQQVDIPFVAMRYDRRAIARYGLTVRDVSHAIETAFRGQSVTRVKEGQASFDLIVRYDPEVLLDFDSLGDVVVATPSGALVPVRALADVRKDVGPNAITRENVQRKIVVSCNVAGRDLRSVVDDIRDSIDAEIDFPDRYHVDYGGQFEAAERASRTLLVVGLAAVAGIFLLLFVAFRSIRDAGLVMLNLPLALIGGVAGVYLAGGAVTVASIIGFISLFGIATRNGIMMISHIRHLVEKEGVRDAVEAVRRGAVERLAPILMTALASGLGLLPLALSVGEAGGEIQAPMAIVILCGLVTSTALNMVVVPALFLRFGSVHKLLM
ncbi:MAG: efflux RND transporter permease subunit [Deltaproteobacteria bacterium]|nr:efflux RND transporter permease subunit [Deltaproteobacteria bacterium]